MKERPILSGLMFGLLTYKPQLAIFPFLLLLVTGERKVLLWSVIFTLLTSVCKETAAIQPTLYKLLRLMSVDGIALRSILLLVGIIATFIVIRIWKLSERMNLSGAVIVLSIFMFIPYFVEYDLILLSILFVLLSHDLIVHGYKKYEFITCICLWIIPLINMLLVMKTRIQISPFIAAIMLVLVLRRAWQDHQILKELA